MWINKSKIKKNGLTTERNEIIGRNLCKRKNPIQIYYLTKKNSKYGFYCKYIYIMLK